MTPPFQLSLELTNLLNPITSTISTLGSIALVKAIRDAGSDFLTELELAFWMSRNRIDPVILVHFRQAIRKTEQTKIAEYLEIVLHLGAGPTVLNALKDPEPSSMVIQLSYLCSVFETESLAHGIVEAISENDKELSGNPGNVPNYSALCETLRVCKQETVDFQWEGLFEAVGKKVGSSKGRFAARSQFIHSRRIPYSVHRVLLLCLHSLQHFPDDRCLHVRCDEGISTVIVWCYYILGLNVSLNYNEHNFVFGTGTPNVFLQQNRGKKEQNQGDQPSYATLLRPGNKNEPLFRLSPEIGQPELQLESRRQARGFAIEIIRRKYSGKQSIEHVALLVTRRALQILEAQTEASRQKYASIPLNRGGRARSTRRCRNYETKIIDITPNKVVHAAKVLVDLDLEDEIVCSEDEDEDKVHFNHFDDLIMLLFSLALVQFEDLQSCGDLPLLNDAWKGIKEDRNDIWQGIKDYTWILDFRRSDNFEGYDFDLIDASKVLSAFLEGSDSPGASDKSSVLTSSCGRSLFFGAVSFLDPWDARTSTLRLVRGVPVRDCIRRERAYDGPTDSPRAPSAQAMNTEDPCGVLVEGPRQMVRGRYLYGHRGSDAFEVTQIFHCNDPKASKTRPYLLGF